jgi:hypothetical protein
MLPAALFWYMAVAAIIHFRTAPAMAVITALFCGAVAALFTRIVWQERFPLRKR